MVAHLGSTLLVVGLAYVFALRMRVEPQRRDAHPTEDQRLKHEFSDYSRGKNQEFPNPEDIRKLIYATNAEDKAVIPILHDSTLFVPPRESVRGTGPMLQ
jgi:hypothetical protein